MKPTKQRERFSKLGLRALSCKHSSQREGFFLPKVKTGARSLYISFRFVTVRDILIGSEDAIDGSGDVW